MTMTGRECPAAWRVRATLCVLCLGVVLGGLIYAMALGNRLRYPDERDYVALAQRLWHAGVYELTPGHPTAYRPPGYPMLLACVAGLGEGMIWFRAINMLALGGCVALVYRLTARAHGAGAGLLAAGMAAAYPLNLYVAGTLYPQAVAAAVFLLMLDAWNRSDAPAHVPEWRGGATLGLLSGVLLLLAPSFLLVCGLFPAAMVLRRRWQASWWVAWAAALLVCLLPWTLRNQRVFGEFVFLSTNTGINLLLGNSENTTPNAGVNVDLSRYTVEARAMSEPARNRYFTREALVYMADHTGPSLRLYAQKFLNYFNYRNRLYVAGEASPARDVLLLVTYGPLLALALWRVLGFRRLPLSRLEWFLVWLYLANGAFQALFFTRIRHRAPFDYLLVCLAAPLLWRWVSGLPARCSSSRPVQAGCGGDEKRTV